MSPRILITGGAGFIGSHLADYFDGLGWETHIADRFTYAGKIRNIPEFLKRINLWVGDLKEPEFCAKLIGAQFWDYIVHAAGQTHVDRSIDNPLPFVYDNIIGTTRLLEAVADHRQAFSIGRGGVPRMLIYSTDEVFGSTPQGERFDERAAFNPSNPYSATKVAVEAMANAFHATWDLPISIIRPSNTYGTRQHPEKAIPKFVRQAVRGDNLTVHGDGSGARDWLHARDHARAVEFILQAKEPGGSYNVGAGDEHSDQEVADAVIRLTGSLSRVDYIDQRLGHDRRYWMDCSKVRSLGWEPRVKFPAGLAEAVRWNQEHQDWWTHDYISLRMVNGGGDDGHSSDRAERGAAGHL